MTTTAPANQEVAATSGGRDRAGLIAAVVLGLVYAGAGILRYRNWWSGAIDLGVFDQGVYLLSRGMAPEVTINGRNLFADHLSISVLVFVPLYRLVATPYWLFLAQGAALGATVLPLRAFAREEGVAPWVATLAVACGTPLSAAAMFEFHPATLAVPFVAWAALEARRGNVERATVAGVLILLCRAELAWVLMGLAIVGAPVVRRRFVGLSLAGIVFGFTVPALLGARGTFDVHFGHLGSSPKDAVLHPWRILEALASADTMTKLIILFLPVGFLTFLKPRWTAATLVAAAPLVLSRWPGTSMPWFHYWAPMYPLAVAGALVALGDPERHRLVRPALVVAGAAAAVAFMSPVSPRAPGPVSVESLTRYRHDRADAVARANIGPNDSVVATSAMLAHLTHRQEAWLFPAPYAAAEPAELSPTPSKAAAARVDVIVLEGDAVDQAKEYGIEGDEQDGILTAHP
ncbi:MAG: DUF2079 domain-containing protein [Acidimicrobiales bacterium]|nr:DUF2079 domain-containing protein [Actinomycetota bacterium]